MRTAGAAVGAAAVDLVVSLGVGAAFAAGIAVALIAALATAWILGVGVLVRAGALRLAAAMARFDRGRLARLGYAIEPPARPAAPPGSSFRVRQLAWGRARGLWRPAAFQLVRLPLAGAAAFVVVGWCWAAVVSLVLAGGPAGPVDLLGWAVGPAGSGPGRTLGLVVAGAVGLAGVPVLVRGAAGLQARVAAAMLGVSRSRRLADEVTRLDAARALAVESADAERRRIERDLHDGLQPQLVALALDLGLARSRFDRDPSAARALVERAHGEAKRAAEDLRNLVRGIHPSVLDERGLDAALSALVAGCPVPVSVAVALSGRVDPTRESVAYFVVAEAITNVSKHADARAARVAIEADDSRLRVVVEDDGRGGARMEAGGGLTGLAARVASVDGTLTLSSPTGGPTRVEAVIPCGR